MVVAVGVVMLNGSLVFSLSRHLADARPQSLSLGSGREEQCFHAGQLDSRRPLP